ncbi:MAG: hypothetical protein IPM91_16400, partial [Bacteroidetes bacterium]|nr:hypothetical protein [Bacteroidota bacterium]
RKQSQQGQYMPKRNCLAAHLGTQHHEFIISHKEVINSIELGFEGYDEPNADSSIIPPPLVSKLAKEHVTVALSGEGGDELFLGYGSYQWAQRLSSPIYKLLKNCIRNLTAYVIEISAHRQNDRHLRLPKQEWSYILTGEQYFSLTKKSLILR